MCGMCVMPARLVEVCHLGKLNMLEEPNGCDSMLCYTNANP